MIKINLLSPSDRTSAKWGKINNLIVFNFLILIIGQFIFAFIFLVSIKYLDIENSNLNKQLENMQVQSEIKEVEEIKTNIKGCDEQLRVILKLQEDRFNFTRVLEDFSKIIPVGVKINNINIKPKENGEKENINNSSKFDFEITGIVKNRENLLEFENSLRDSEIFVDLIIDLSNYDNKNNDFSYRMTADIN